MHIERVRDAASDAVADYARLTDVTLRSAHEPAQRALHRRIGQGHPARDRRRAPAAVGAHGGEVAARPRAVARRRSTSPCTSPTPSSSRRSPATACTGGPSPHSSGPALPDPAVLLADARRVVVLEDIVDHTNVGAIFRSVAALGADAVLVSPRCADPLYRRSVRVSMGTVFQVPWTRLPEWPEAAADAARPRLLDRRPRPRRRRGLAPRPRRRPARAARARVRRRGRRAQQRTRSRPPTASSRSPWRTASTRSTSRPPRPSCSTPSPSMREGRAR